MDEYPVSYNGISVVWTAPCCKEILKCMLSIRGLRIPRNGAENDVVHHVFIQFRAF